MDSPVHWECREADQHTTLCYGRSIEVCMRFLERMRRAQVAFTRPDAIDYSAHDLAHSIPSYLSRGCIGRKRFNKKFHNGLDHLRPEELCIKTAVGSFLDSFTHGGGHCRS